MRLARLLAASALVAGSAMVATATPASAHPVDVLVVTDTTSCPATYGELARVGGFLVCVHTLGVPRWHLVTDGRECLTGYAEYSVIDFFRVCIDWGHTV